MNDRMMRCCLLLCLLPGITVAALRSPSQIIPGAVSAKAVAARDELVLSLSDAIALALRDNRSIRSAYLQRIADKFELRVAADRYAPQLSFKAQYQANRNQDDRYRQAELTPSASVLTAYGTRVSLDWAYGQTRGNAAGPRYRDGANLMLIQPLLRGAGRDIAMAPLHQAELAEQANRLALKDQVSHTITRIIGLYRDLLRAQEQLNITDDARQRASQLIAVNRELIDAGRALDLSRRKLAIEQEKLALGLSSNFQVLSFESDLRGAQSARLDAQIAYLNAQTALDLILGTTLDSWDVAIND